MNNNLKTIRKNLKYSQQDIANLIGIPLNTLQNWEQNVRTPSQWVMNLIMDRMLKVTIDHKPKISESKGILSFFSIQKIVSLIAAQHHVKKVVLFGSYAKGLANPRSDLDLYMVSNLSGLAYFEFAEKLRQALKKKVDLFSSLTLETTSPNYLEIEDTGIIIYER
jgi:predicted nucleotidyltransferase/DNA-binding XRE family transcriptional regulator